MVKQFLITNLFINS